MRKPARQRYVGENRYNRNKVRRIMREVAFRRRKIAQYGTHISSGQIEEADRLVAIAGEYKPGGLRWRSTTKRVRKSASSASTSG